jgi:hypothetical protein
MQGEAQLGEFHRLQSILGLAPTLAWAPQATPKSTNKLAPALAPVCQRHWFAPRASMPAERLTKIRRREFAA